MILQQFLGSLGVTFRPKLRPLLFLQLKQKQNLNLKERLYRKRSRIRRRKCPRLPSSRYLRLGVLRSRLLVFPRVDKGCQKQNVKEAAGVLEVTLHPLFQLHPRRLPLQTKVILPVTLEALRGSQPPVRPEKQCLLQLIAVFLRLLLAQGLVLKRIPLPAHLNLLRLHHFERLTQTIPLAIRVLALLGRLPLPP